MLSRARALVLSPGLGLRLKQYVVVGTVKKPPEATRSHPQCLDLRLFLCTYSFNALCELGSGWVKYQDRTLQI